MVILDFGGQLSDLSGSRLVQLVTTVTNQDIEDLAFEFAKGYYENLGEYNYSSMLYLGIGTNNSYYGVTSSGGASWADRVAHVQSAVESAGYYLWVTVAGASDMEQGYNWASATDTKNWVSGYLYGATTFGLANFGSADGCPTNSYNNASCNNGWTQEDI